MEFFNKIDKFNLSDKSKEDYKSRLRTIAEVFGIESALKFPKVFNKKLEELKYSTQTKMALFGTLVKIDPENTEVRKFRDEYKSVINEHYDSNEPTDRQKEAYVEFEVLIEVRNKLPVGSLDRLLFSMYLDIPPNRADFYKTLLLDQQPEGELGMNYIVLTDKPILVLETYKTAKLYGTNCIDLPISLVDEIRKSLEYFPRKYLFTNKKGEPFTSVGFSQWANKLLRKHSGNDGLSLTMLRHIWISKRSDPIERKSIKERKEIAKKMGHSIGVQSEYLWF